MQIFADLGSTFVNLSDFGWIWGPKTGSKWTLKWVPKKTPKFRSPFDNKKHAQNVSHSNSLEKAAILLGTKSKN